MAVHELSVGQCRASISDHWRIRNPFHSIHALALANLAEAVIGLSVMTLLDQKYKGVIGIVTGMTGKYLKKARGTIHAQCTMNELTIDKEQTISCSLFDQQGQEVAIFSYTWNFKNKRD
jgi:acyl-coenzyme A thioesterase PaaI-like protein